MRFEIILPLLLIHGGRGITSIIGGSLFMKLSWLFVILLLIFVAVFSVQNAEPIAVHFLSWEILMSAALVIQLAALLGALVGLAFGSWSRRTPKAVEKPAEKPVTTITPTRPALAAPGGGGSSTTPAGANSSGTSAGSTGAGASGAHPGISGSATHLGAGSASRPEKKPDER